MQVQKLKKESILPKAKMQMKAAKSDLLKSLIKNPILRSLIRAKTQKARASPHLNANPGNQSFNIGRKYLEKEAKGVKREGV